MAYQGLNTPTPPFQNLTVTYIIQNGCYRASYMKMYLTPPFLVFHPPSLSLLILFLHSCITGIWLEIILMCVYMSFHIFKWSRTGFFFSVALQGERFDWNGYMRMLSADPKSRGLHQEHGVNSRRIHLMWVCGSVCLTVCFSAGMSSVNPSSLSLTQIRSAAWVICFFFWHVP